MAHSYDSIHRENDVSPYYREKLCTLFGMDAVSLGLREAYEAEEEPSAMPQGYAPALVSPVSVPTVQHRIEIENGCLVIHAQEPGMLRFSPSETKAVLRLLLIEHLTI